MSGGNPYGPPRVDFGWLGQIGNTFQGSYDAAQKKSVLAQIGEQLAASGGTDPAAFAQGGARALQGGDFDMGLRLMQVGQQQRQLAAGETASRDFAGMFGGGNSSQPGSLPSAGTVAPASAGGAATADRSVPSMVGMDPSVAPLAPAVRTMESGSAKGNYQAVGPTHPTMGRALGAYQIMEANLPQWSQAALGREVSPQEFLADPKLQDAIFNHRMGQSLAQYGNPQDALSVWHSGRPLAQAQGRQDALGTRTPDYVARGTSLMADAPAAGAQNAQFQIPGQAPVSAPAATGTTLDRLPYDKLARMASNPNLPKPQQEMAQKLFLKKIDAEPGDSLMSDAERAQDPRLAAYPGPIVKKQNGGVQLLGEQFYGPQSAAKITAQGNLAQSNVIRKDEGEQVVTARGHVTPAYEIRDRLGLMQQSLESLPDSAFGTFGPGGLTVAKAMQGVGNFLGIDPGEDANKSIANREIFDKYARQVAGELAKSVGGSRVTNFDFQQFIQSNPSLLLSRQGNQRLLDIAQQLNDRKVAVGEFAQSLGADDPDSYRKLAAFERQHVAKNPILDRMGGTGKAITPSTVIDPEGKRQFYLERSRLPKDGGGDAPRGPRVTSPEQAAKLPKGTPIILPDGSQGYVP